MKRAHRGYALVFAMASIVTVFTAVMLLGFAVSRRTRAASSEFQRETAVRQAEGALEAARQAISAGRLSVPGVFEFEGARVNCTAIASGVRVETFVLFHEATIKPERGGSRLRRGVRVSWDLAQGESPGSPAWRRVAWHARNETVAP